MKLGPLASAAGLEAGAASEAEVTGFAIDHRKVAPGNVFGAFEGTVVNGEDFIPAAVAGGAVAVVARPEAPVEGAPLFTRSTQVVRSARPLLDGDYKTVTVRVWGGGMPDTVSRTTVISAP